MWISWFLHEIRPGQLPPWRVHGVSVVGGIERELVGQIEELAGAGAHGWGFGECHPISSNGNTGTAMTSSVYVTVQQDLARLSEAPSPFRGK